MRLSDELLKAKVLSDTNALLQWGCKIRYKQNEFRIKDTKRSQRIFLSHHIFKIWDLNMVNF